jgi:hypothetical protein
MKQTTVLAAAVALALLLAPAVRPQGRRRRTPQPPPRPAPEFIARSLESPDAGEVAGRIYTNKFFGLRLSYPEGWFVLSDVGKEAIKERAPEIVKPGQPRRDIERALERTYNLFSVAQYFTAPPGETSASMLCVAEALPVTNLTPLQFARYARDYVIPQMNLKIEVLGEPEAERVGGEEFAVLRLRIESPLGPVTQEHHVTIRRGYAVAFTLTYTTAGQRAKLGEVLDSVSFQGAGK